MSVFQNKGIWRYHFMIRGRRYFKALPECKNKTQAKAAEERRKAAIYEDRDEETRANTQFKAFIETEFLPWIETNKSAGTYKSYKWRCSDLAEVFGSLDLTEVSTFGVEKFKRTQMKRVTRRGAEQSPASVNRYLQCLASIFSHAERMKLIKIGARPEIELLREDNRRIRYLTTEEESKLRAVARQYWPYLDDLIVIDTSTGLRREELFALKKEDVDLTLNVIHVMKGKGGKSRRVPLDPDGEARRVLARLCRESRSDWIFTSPHSKGKFTRVDKSLAAAWREAKLLEPVTLHTLRHTFGTRLAAAGVDVRTIQELMGHSDITTTMRYVHLVESQAHSAVVKLSNFNKFATQEDRDRIGQAG